MNAVNRFRQRDRKGDGNRERERERERERATEVFQSTLFALVLLEVLHTWILRTEKEDCSRRKGADGVAAAAAAVLWVGRTAPSSNQRRLHKH